MDQYRLFGDKITLENEPLHKTLLTMGNSVMELFLNKNSVCFRIIFAFIIKNVTKESD